MLVACEFSGRVRDAFRARGHNATSCDLLPTESLGDHYQCDVLEVLDEGWDLMIAHPPCTYLSAAGTRWWKGREKEQQEAAEFFMALINANIPKICVENPRGAMSRLYRMPDQRIQPWQFGHGETKETCLWLKNLPPLVPTNVVEGREQRIHMMGETKDRWKKRSLTYL